MRLLLITDEIREGTERDINGFQRLVMMRKHILYMLLSLAAVFLLISCGTGQLTEETPKAEPEILQTETISSDLHDTELPVETASQEIDIQTDEGTETTGAIFEEPETEPFIPQDSFFRIYYLDVGQGDASLILCDGEAMLIDGGNASQSDLIYSFLKKNKINKLKYIICTHPDEDHVGGLAGALNYATAEHAYCSETEYDSRAFNSFLKYLEKQNILLEIPDTGDTVTLGSAKAQFVGPIKEAAGTNNNSLVIKITYGKTSFLFTGDAEAEEEDEILGAGYDIECTVLKVGHHGSNSSTSGLFLNTVRPQYAVISCGAYNEYGHPTDQVLERIKATQTSLFRTDLQGDIICESDGEKLTFSTEKNPKADVWTTNHDLYGENETELVPVIAGGSTEDSSDSDMKVTYILNKRSEVFHYPDCDSVNQMAEQNKIYFTGTRDDAIAEGYHPCGNCHP